MKSTSLIIAVLIAIGLIWLNFFKPDKAAILERKVISSAAAPAPVGPYSQAIKAGNVVFLSGQIALDNEGQMDTASLEQETRRVMTNLEAVLKETGLGFQNVVKTTIYLTDISAFQEVNKVYGSYFIGNAPARETVGVAALPKGAHVEISMIAVADAG